MRSNADIAGDDADHLCCGLCGVEAQIQSQFRAAADFRRRSRSKIDRAHPLSGSGGFRPLEPALFEEKVVELQIVERASDNTIGRTLKKTFSNRIASRNG